MFWRSISDYKHQYEINDCQVHGHTRTVMGVRCVLLMYTSVKSQRNTPFSFNVHLIAFLFNIKQ